MCAMHACVHPCSYRIADYFRRVLIFVIFVANPGVTKFSTHEIFTRTLVQVCGHQRSLYFVDVVASYARLDTEALHLSSSLVYPDAYRRESGYALLVENENSNRMHPMSSKFALCYARKSIIMRHEI